MKIFLFPILLFILIPIFADEPEQQRKFNITGTMRFRGFALSRDTLLSRQNPTYPYYNPPLEASALDSSNAKMLNAETAARLTGKPSTLTPRNENLNYFDSRVLLSFEFFTSQYFDGFAGVQIGDMTFGGKSISNSDRNNPSILGSGTGGELGQQTPVNLRSNFLYINVKLKEYDFTSRYGIQFFSSALGRLVFAIGSGAVMTKGIPSYKLTLEGGWIRTRERTAADLDGNGYNDKRQNVNVFFLKAKFLPTSGYSLELYNYSSTDNDQTDPFRETGNLYWWGVFNEWRYGTFTIMAHGIYNHGNLKALRSVRNLNEQEVYQQRNHYSISGGLWDFQVSYSYNREIKLNLIGVGTTGRPGYSKDGVPAGYKGGGYRTIFPDFTISNIAIDFTGGYALFSASNMSGLYEVGSFVNIIVPGPFELTVGYYHLYANRSPIIENNRDYNAFYSKDASNFMGREYNLNLRWNVLSDFQLLFRSGYFETGNGLKALMDSRAGSYIKEAFLTAEYKF